MQTEQILRKIKHIVDSAASILITGQSNPDGDSLGSQLALRDMLRQQQRYDGQMLAEDAIIIVNDEPPPSQYRFFPHLDRVRSFEDIQHRQFDVGFVLDSGSDRVGRVLPILKKCRHTVNIDHHQTRRSERDDVSWIDPAICSVAEMVYAFIEHPAWNVTLNADIATCLYAGLIYDTNSFRYPKTTPRTLQIAAKLIETGIDFTRIAEHLFLEKPFSSLQLISAVLHNLQRASDGEIIWGTVTQALLNTTQAHPDATEDLIAQYAFTEGVKVAVLFKELSEHRIKVSFRSRGALDVGRFAQKTHKAGGGHVRAAGFTMDGTMQEAETLVIEALQRELLRVNP